MNPTQISKTQGCDFLQLNPEDIKNFTTFTPEDFSLDDQMMIEVAEDFSRKEVVPLAERLDKQEPGLMPLLVKKAGELGLCGVDSPEIYGGLGLGKNIAGRILEFLSLNASFSVTYGISSGIGQLGLNLFGSETQKQKYLPGILSGQKIAAYALSEPNAGSDALSLSSRAIETSEGFVLNGTKMWISNALWADLFIVIAKVNGEKVTAFLVEKEFPGVSIGREENKMGLKGSSTARLIFEDVLIPKANVLHDVGLGHQVAFNALNIGRFKLAPMSMGPARDAIGLAANYAKERKQFGQSISEFGLIQRKFGMMASLFFASESMTYRTGAMLDEAFEVFGGTPEGNRKAAEEYAIECSMGKVFVTEAESTIIDEALQCYGGYGFTEEFPIARHYRDSRVSRIYEGTNEINRIFIVDRLQKRINEGRITTPFAGEGFIGELIAKAWDSPRNNQVQKGAIADLLILQYAHQSTYLRAKRCGEIGMQLFHIFDSWSKSRALEAYQLICDQAVTVPKSEKLSFDEISHLVGDQAGPIRF